MSWNSSPVALKDETEEAKTFMRDIDHFVVFTLDEKKFALKLNLVVRITRAVEITSLPKAPTIILGIINFQGRVIPVVNMRKRFNLKPKQINVEDHFIIGKTSTRSVAIWVDSVLDIITSHEKDIIGHDTILPNIDYVEGVIKYDDEMLLIHDLDKVLLLEDEEKLEEALLAFTQSKTSIKTEKQLEQ